MKDLYNKLVPFLRDIFLDVKESGRSFKQYFEPRAENIEQFKQTRLFKKHLLQYKERNEIVERLFEKMTKDFNDGVAHLYMPVGESGEGHFTEEQKLIFYKLADLITQQTGALAIPPSPKETISTTTKNLEEAGNLKIVQPLKLNSKTGFIEGKVTNPNDGAELLSVLIDPNNPDEIIFQNEKDNIAFALENSVNGLGIFIGASTKDVMALAGYVETAGGVFKKPESTVLGTLPPGTTLPGTTLPGTTLPGTPTQGALSEPELSGLQPGAETAGAETAGAEAESAKEFLLPELGISGTSRTPGLPGAPRPLYKPVRTEMATPQRIPEYATNLNEPQLKAPLGPGPGRYTEQGLKKEQAEGKPEERQPERKKAQPQTTETAEEEAQPGKNKKSSKGKAALLAGAVLGGGGITTVILTAADIV